MEVSKISISILIRTYNSSKTLGVLLSRLTLEKNDEIIVVDSGSEDDTLMIAESYGARIFHAPPPFHYSKSLNLGFEVAKNSWVLVISSHSIPVVSNFLETWRSEIPRFTEDVVVAYAPSTISGMSDPNLDDEETAIYTALDYNRIARICNNANSLYRKNAWVEQPFDQSVRTAEDRIWIMQMISKGHRFCYFPKARTKNCNQGDLIYMFRKGYRDARALRKTDHQPMKLWHLGGGIKNHIILYIKRNISLIGLARLSAHIVGQFFGSRRSEDNLSLDGAS